MLKVDIMDDFLQLNIFCSFGFLNCFCSYVVVCVDGIVCSVADFSTAY